MEAEILELRAKLEKNERDLEVSLENSRNQNTSVPEEEDDHAILLNSLKKASGGGDILINLSTIVTMSRVR